MHTWSLLPPVSVEERAILHDLVRIVIPPEGSRNWTRFNELEFVHAVVNRWLKKHYDFHVSPADLYAAFAQHDHLIKVVGWDHCGKDLTVELEHRSFAPYSDLDAWRIHFNVSVPMLKLLLVNNRALPAQAPAYKHATQQKLMQRLNTLAQQRPTKLAA